MVRFAPPGPLGPGAPRCFELVEEAASRTPPAMSSPLNRSDDATTALGLLRALANRLRSLAGHLHDSDRRVASQTFWMGAMTATTVMGGLVQTFFSARILGPEGFGVLAVIVAVAGLVQLILSVPGGDTVTTFVTRAVLEGRRDEAESILRFALIVSQGLSLAACGIIAGLAITAEALLGIDDAHGGAMLLYSLTVVFSATGSEAMAVLRLANRVPMGLAVTVAAVIVRLGLHVAVWLTGGGLLGVVFAHVAGAAVQGGGMLLAAAASASRAGMPGLPHSLSVRVPPDVMKFQSGMFARTTVGALNRHLDTILLTQFAGVADIGLYRGGRRIVDVAKEPLKKMQLGVKVEYSRLWFSGEGPALRRMTLRFTLLSTALAAAGFGLLAVGHEWIIRLILGPEFSGVGPLLLILLVGAFADASLSMATVLPIAAGRNWSLLLLGVLRLTVFALAVTWLAPHYGAAGAAWARTAAALVYVAAAIPCIASVLRQPPRPR
ncbi:MAG: lipopolysaccharide biosynthesis protein [Acidobacteria bacterium]|nr:lipopolysaccharide biosynthesis protein [Acidobacteriota bacterium]